MEKKMNAIKEYLKFYPDSFEAKQNLTFCTYMQELIMENNGSYYPRMKGMEFRLNEQMSAHKNYYLTNHATDYVPNGVDTIIVWKADAGRCDFVLTEYWYSIGDEWEWFMNVLKSYNPLDYDEINNTYLYDVVNGARLYNEYTDILNEFHKKLKKRITAIQIEKKKKELERLQTQ